MSFVSRMVERVLKWRRFRPPKTFEERLLWLSQPCIAKIEDIILWKNPAASVSVIGAVNIIFLLIWHLEMRLLGVIFALALMCVFAEGVSAWFLNRASQNTSSRQQILRGSSTNSGDVLYAAAERARQWLVSRMAHLLALRKQNPPQFCLLMVVMLFTFAIFGSMISGVLLLYLCSMGLLLVPGLAPKALSALKGIHPQTDSDGEVEGFMPEMSPQVIAELHKAGDVVPVTVMEIDKISDIWLPENSVNGDRDSSSDDGSNGKSVPSILGIPPDISDSSSCNSSDEEFLPRHISIRDNGQVEERPIPSAPPHIASSFSGWSESALGALGSLGGAIGAILPSGSVHVPAKRYTRNDSEDSDEFELVDKDNL